MGKSAGGCGDDSGSSNAPSSDAAGRAIAARDFLAETGLPQAWRGQPAWCILETGFGLGLGFLLAWQAWKTDPNRPRLLHYVGTEGRPSSTPEVQAVMGCEPVLYPLAEQLCKQWWGLLPGVHRLVFEDGQVLLTLCIGKSLALLRDQAFAADSVYLNHCDTAEDSTLWSVHFLKAVARCCRIGARVSCLAAASEAQPALAQTGFVAATETRLSAKPRRLQAQYQPAWAPRLQNRMGALGPALVASHCIVVGAGLAGAAVASSLARRGWRVLVLDSASSPADGASGLPVGLLAPHFSSDDSLLSRLSRSGVRLTLQQARALLRHGEDWELTGVLQRHLPRSGTARQAALPPVAWHAAWPEALAAWTQAALPTQLSSAGLAPQDDASWHPAAGWIKPAQLVGAWLAAPGIEWRGNCTVTGLLRGDGGWQVGAQGGAVYEAPLVVLAAALGCSALVNSLKPSVSGTDTRPALDLQALSGQISWNRHASKGGSTADRKNWPPFPVNGHGSFLPRVPMGDAAAWVMGSSFERDAAEAQVSITGHAENLERLGVLLPSIAAQLQDDCSSVQGWAGQRCTTPTRLPLLSRLVASSHGGVWAATGMGSRGLTFAHLCGELLAARLHREPLPVGLRLAEALQR